MSAFVKISDLLANLGCLSTIPDSAVNGLAIDSRKVLPGYAFIACLGGQMDGRDYIEDAIKRGAVAIFAEAINYVVQKQEVPLLLIPNLTQKISIIASRFYQQPASHLSVIGVTGTNGKTSCSQFIAQALSQQGTLCGVIGTLGEGFPGDLRAIEHTTPDALLTQQLLAQLLERGAQAVAMEVSSHALVQGRVNAVNFHTAVFTNLTRDHLDYHGDMEHYAAAKRRLFEYPNLRYAVINVDDPFGVLLAEELAKKLEVFIYSLNEQHLHFPRARSVFVKNIEYSTAGFTANIISPWGTGQFSQSLLGKFNVSNLLAVLTVLNLCGVGFDSALEQLSLLKGIPGRMQTLGGGRQPLVVIDYAHTPDALQQVLVALRLHCYGQLWCVFGCGGNRDRGKRAMMGRVAEHYADRIILTDDNPRHELPQKIIADIMQGIVSQKNIVIEHNRRRALAHALACAKSGDIILVAGKGHESYQQVGDEKLPFSDELEIKLLLG